VAFACRDGDSGAADAAPTYVTSNWNLSFLTISSPASRPVRNPLREIIASFVLVGHNLLSEGATAGRLQRAE